MECLGTHPGRYSASAPIPTSIQQWIRSDLCEAQSLGYLFVVMILCKSLLGWWQNKAINNRGTPIFSQSQGQRKGD